VLQDLVSGHGRDIGALFWRCPIFIDTNFLLAYRADMKTEPKSPEPPKDVQPVGQAEADYANDWIKHDKTPRWEREAATGGREPYTGHGR